jgi:hypothetical protein
MIVYIDDHEYEFLRVLMRKATIRRIFGIDFEDRIIYRRRKVL